MRAILRATVVAALAFTALSVTATATAAPSANGTYTRPAGVGRPPGSAACTAYVPHRPRAGRRPSGSGGDLRSAYNLRPPGRSTTVAIVDAYDAPDRRADLAATARSTAGRLHTAPLLPARSSPEPGTATRWAQEIRSTSTCLGDLPELPHPAGRGEDELVRNLGTPETARDDGANIISNSWGGSDSADTTYGA